MLNLTRENLKKIKNFCKERDIEVLTSNIRNMMNDEEFSVFTLMSMLDTMVILHDDKGENITRYITMKENDRSNYLVMSADRSVEDMRFNAACMLRRVIKSMKNGGNVISLNTSSNNSFTREEKYFACSLLMPKKELLRFIMQKDSAGNYIYLNENKELPFKNIHAVADHFGVPFSKCCSRIFYVFDDLRVNKKGNFYIEGCYDRREYKVAKENYLKTDWKKDRDEVAPNHQKNREERVRHLLDSLHYRSYSKLSDVAKRRLLVNLAKFDSVNEGVVKDEKEAKDIINNYIASGGKVVEGKLVTKDQVVDLSDEQLVVIGEYQLYEKALERGLLLGIAKSDATKENITSMDYKSAINSLTERDLVYYICSLHKRLFSKLSDKYGEERGGRFRTGEVRLQGVNIKTADPREIRGLMENVAWKILDALKKNAEGKLSNSEYIERINACIYEMIRMQPFSDGNKRTARLLSNLLYQEKGIPFVLLSIKEWDNYVDAWSSDDVNDYNNFMHKRILESYSYFYGDQSASDVFLGKRNSEKIILANKRK